LLPKVGCNQRCFEIIKGIAVNFFAESDDFINALTEVLPRTRHCLFHPVE
jgi:hypothetical protein